jgi:hypothetical protein
MAHAKREFFLNREKGILSFMVKSWCVKIEARAATPEISKLSDDEIFVHQQ